MSTCPRQSIDNFHLTFFTLFSKTFMEPCTTKQAKMDRVYTNNKETCVSNLALPQPVLKERSIVVAFER